MLRPVLYRGQMFARFAVTPIRAPAIAALFACLSGVFLLMLIVVLPPIQGPDEGAHYARAEQISRGEFIAYRPNPNASGGRIHLGVIDASVRFYAVVANPKAHVTPALYAPIAWGSLAAWSFPYTSLYPPIFYLPAAAGIFAGKRLGLDVLQTGTLARLCLAFASLAIATLAIALAGPAAIWLFTLLLLPASADLMACITQDGPMLSGAALAGSLLLRLQRPASTGWWPALACTTLLLAIIVMTRPPYILIALLPLAPRSIPLVTRITACATILTLSAIWWTICAAHIFVSDSNRDAGNAAAQLHLLLTHPANIPGLLVRTMQASFIDKYAGYFITTFAPPSTYNAAAWAALALAAICVTAAGGRPLKPVATLTALAILGSIAGILLIQYLSWTPVAAPTIQGVMGRYFLPLAALLPLAMAGRQWAYRGPPAWLAAPVVAFPILSITLTLHQILLRYYL